MHGRAAHASTRNEGASAIDAYLPVHAALARLEAARNTAPDPLMAEYPIPYALSVGKVRAGDWASSVPDRLVAEGRSGCGWGRTRRRRWRTWRSAWPGPVRRTRGCGSTRRR
ncbi:peptidase dimerization domain-containing protein [Kitasatospora arboriphila]